MAVRLCKDKTVKENRVTLQQGVSFKKYVLNILLLSYATDDLSIQYAIEVDHKFNGKYSGQNETSF
jgi:hypothetical protein